MHNHPIRSVPRAFAGLALPEAEATPVQRTNVIEMRTCAWCERPCVGRDEDGDPACPEHVSEDAGDQAAMQARDARQHGVEHVRPRNYDREVHDFVIGEFRAFRALTVA